MVDKLRRWQLTTPITLAADARLTLTDYTDDQVWELVPGLDDEPALRLQTRYGGRVSLASLVPMWTVNNEQRVHETQEYAERPQIVTFTPSSATAEAFITATLKVEATYWVMSSHAIGARFTLTNTGDTPLSVRADIFGHVIEHKKPRALAILSLSDDTMALNMGYIGNSRPVVVMENADTDLSPNRKASPKIGVTLEVAPNESQSVQWAHAGLDTLERSFSRARLWLQQDWDQNLGEIETTNAFIPNIETGDSELDLVFARSYQQLMQSFLTPRDDLSHSAFVANRHIDKGFSKQGTGKDYGRGWNGQTFKLAYLVGCAVAPIAPDLAKGIIQNYIDIQDSEGFIDAAPGLAGQRSKNLLQPILARLAWIIYEYTDDKDFLKSNFPQLLDFFRRWFKSDHDTEFDGVPEWQNERQTGYTGFPSFDNNTWSQGVNIKYFETPDLIAYLLSEAHYLKKIGQEIGDDIAAMGASQRVRDARLVLDQMWYNNRYSYRERDTDGISAATIVIEDGRGDEEHIPSIEINPPQRLIVRITGGTNRAPNAVIHIEGIDHNGKQFEEVADGELLNWTYGKGFYTTHRIFSRIDRIRCTRLSRVYTLDVSSVDTTRIDINAIMPILSEDIQEDKAETLIDLIKDENHFYRPNGLTIVSAKDPAYDPSSAQGGGGVWAYWLTLICEGLITYGQAELAVDMLKRLLNVQKNHLIENNTFHEFYNSDELSGHGEEGYLEGIAPLHLFMKLIGIRVISTGRVQIGHYYWDEPITLTQLGIKISRSQESTSIQFPSGHEVTLDQVSDWQLIEDPNPAPMPKIPTSLQKQTSPLSSDKRVIIGIEHEEDTESQE